MKDYKDYKPTLKKTKQTLMNPMSKYNMLFSIKMSYPLIHDIHTCSESITSSLTMGRYTNKTKHKRKVLP